MKAFLLLIEKAYASGDKYDFYNLITGQDFYACNFDKFEELLQKEKIYVSYFSLPDVYKRQDSCCIALDICKMDT